MMRKNKPLLLQEKVLRTYLIVIISMSLLILIAFNLSMSLFINKTAQSQIDESRETVKVLLKKAVKDLKDTDSLLPKAREFTIAINQSFKLTEMTSESEIALINASGEVLLPKSTDLSGLMRTITDDVSTKILRGVKFDTFHINFDKERYLVSYEAYNETALNNRSQYLVIVVSQKAATLLLRRTNFILIAVVCFTTLLGTLIFRKLAREITQPIGYLSNYAKSIASGNFETMAINEDTLEIAALCHDLNTMSQNLQKAEQMKVDFLQNFSHDLRTPLMSIQGYAEGIATGVFPEATKPAAIIASESLRLKHLVDQLITLSRLDMSKTSVAIMTVNLHDFFTLLMSRYEGLATNEGKKIVLNCPNGFEIQSNDELLEKLFGNLLSNAIRYAKSYVVIDVILDDVKGLCIRLQDDGPGIPDSELPHLFDRFYKGKAGNFGLGLAIAKTAAILLGFKLKAENHAFGALFTVENLSIT